MNSHAEKTVLPDAPEVSVLLSVHNRAELLPETIDSVLAQDFDDFEFLIMDDGSSETEVSKVLNDYRQQDARIGVHHQQNKGLTQALIELAEQARGRYLARIDNGDCMHPERLVKQCDFLDEHADCAFVSSRTDFFGPEWEYLYTQKGSPSGDPVRVKPADKPNGVDADVSHHGSVMIRQTAYRQAGGYRAAFAVGQDWDLWYRLFEQGSYACLPEPLYRARHFPASISMVQSARQQQIAGLSRAAYQARQSGTSEKSYLAQAARIGVQNASTPSGNGAGHYFIGETLRKQRHPSAPAYLRGAVAASPWNLKYWLRYGMSVVFSGINVRSDRGRG